MHLTRLDQVNLVTVTSFCSPVSQSVLQCDNSKYVYLWIWVFNSKYAHVVASFDAVLSPCI